MLKLVEGHVWNLSERIAFPCLPPSLAKFNSWSGSPPHLCLTCDLQWEEWRMFLGSTGALCTLLEEAENTRSVLRKGPPESE